MDEPTSLLALGLALALAIERVVTVWINRRNGKPTRTPGERGSTSNGTKAQQLAIDYNREGLETLRQELSGLAIRVEEMGRLLARVDERSQRP